MNSQFSQQTLVLSCDGVSVKSKQKCELKQKIKPYNTNKQRSKGNLRPNPSARRESERTERVQLTQGRLYQVQPQVTLRTKASQGQDVKHAEHHQLTNRRIGWDSAQCLTYSTNYF